ncbi:tobamovirus multiplication protein 2B-like [Neltuma alba]|uniref:tobamovirus multiplication protein 2B-like n=1 Tax=Neltuma alba TaxID=207710 RepID=UPI0010A2FF5C|nr:tobamovirus multiplication protein 2B-like [Prosopis alba]
MASSAGGRSSREGTAKAVVADQISQAAQLVKLPKNLLAKASTIKNTEQVLGHMPGVISTLDAHMESGLRSYLQTWKAVSLVLSLKLILPRRYSGSKSLAAFVHSDISGIVRYALPCFQVSG